MSQGGPRTRARPVLGARFNHDQMTRGADIRDQLIDLTDADVSKVAEAITGGEACKKDATTCLLAAATAASKERAADVSKAEAEYAASKVAIAEKESTNMPVLPKVAGKKKEYGLAELQRYFGLLLAPLDRAGGNVRIPKVKEFAKEWAAGLKAHCMLHGSTLLQSLT